MFEAARKFWRLSPQERAVSIEAFVAVAGFSALCRLAPRTLPMILLRRLAASHDTANADRLTVSRVTAAIRRVERSVPGTTCLGRAYAGGLMLRLRGIPSVVRLGAKLAPDRPFEAHAWLECEGAAVLGIDDSTVTDFVPFRSRT